MQPIFETLLLPPMLAPSDFVPRRGNPLSHRRRQGGDLPQHIVREPARQMTLDQQQLVVVGMLYQASAGFHRALLQTGQRPTDSLAASFLSPAGLP